MQWPFFGVWARRASLAVVFVSCAAVGTLAGLHDQLAHAQQAAPPVPQAQTPPTSGWQTGPKKAVTPAAPARAKSAAEGSVPVTLVAVLTEDGQQIDRGLVWRIFELPSSAKGAPKLLATSRQPAPSLLLASGNYVVNAAFGRAHLTRKITVSPGTPAQEKFVLNAGGLQIKPHPSTTGAASGQAVRYDIYSDERDEFGKRKVVLRRARPELIIRLNAGIYHVVSTYGDANAIVRADVTVEAGKLTKVSVRHTATRVTFKLVRKAGGEALSDTKWQITTPEGQLVKKSAGALPTHVLAAGRYLLNATHGGKTYQREFTLQPGEITHVEVVVP